MLHTCFLQLDAQSYTQRSDTFGTVRVFLSSFLLPSSLSFFLSLFYLSRSLSRSLLPFLPFFPFHLVLSNVRWHGRSVAGIISPVFESLNCPARKSTRRVLKNDPTREKVGRGKKKRKVASCRKWSGKPTQVHGRRVPTTPRNWARVAFPFFSLLRCFVFFSSFYFFLFFLFFFFFCNVRDGTGIHTPSTCTVSNVLTCGRGAVP